MNELTFNQNQIEFVPAKITFNAYDKLKNEATELADFIGSVVVTESTIQSSKKILSASRKAIKNLNAERIRIKKEMMKPYESFEDQIKEIETIVKQANNVVDAQVKHLEEVERDIKKSEIYAMWDKQMGLFDYSELVKFERWFEERFLKKELSLSQIETELNDWLEKVKKDLDFLNSKENKSYVAEYLNCFDITSAMQIVEDREKILNQLNQTNEDVIEFIEEQEEKAIFEITGKANIKLTEILLKENEITFRKV